MSRSADPGTGSFRAVSLPAGDVADGRQPLVLVAGAVALLLPVLYVFPLITPFWSARYLLLFVLIAVAIPIVIANRSEPVVACGLIFSGIAGISTLFSRHPHQAIIGQFAVGTGLVFVLALISAWGLGRAVASPIARRLVVAGLLAGAVANAVLAIAESQVDLSEVGFSGFPGRSSGFFGNPVFLAAFLAGCLWLVLAESTMSLPVRSGLSVLLAAGLQLSGGRAALAVVIVAAILAIRRRPLVGALLVGAIAVGLAGGALLADRAGGQTGSARLGNTSEGWVPRVETWIGGGNAILDSPLIGHGPGRFRTATSKYRTLALVRAEGPGRYFVDAHNLVVEYAVTTGVLGLAALAVWMVLAFRGTAPLTSPLAGFAAAVLALHLLQPQNVALTPLAFLALGAAAPTRLARPSSRILTGGLAALALVAVGVVGYGFFALDQARLDLDRRSARQADALLPRWPQAPEQLARAYQLEALEQGKPQLKQMTLHHRRRAAADDPTNPVPLATLAEFEAELGNKEEAAIVLGRLLALDPWSVVALNGLGLQALERGDEALATVLFTRSLRASAAQPRIARLVKGSEVPKNRGRDEGALTGPLIITDWS